MSLENENLIKGRIEKVKQNISLIYRYIEKILVEAQEDNALTLREQFYRIDLEERRSLNENRYKKMNEIENTLLKNSENKQLAVDQIITSFIKQQATIEDVSKYIDFSIKQWESKDIPPHQTHQESVQELYLQNNLTYFEEMRRIAKQNLTKIHQKYVKISKQERKKLDLNRILKQIQEGTAETSKENSPSRQTELKGTFYKKLELENKNLLKELLKQKEDRLSQSKRIDQLTENLKQLEKEMEQKSQQFDQQQTDLIEMCKFYQEIIDNLKQQIEDRDKFIRDIDIRNSKKEHSHHTQRIKLSNTNSKGEILQHSFATFRPSEGNLKQNQDLFRELNANMHTQSTTQLPDTSGNSQSLFRHSQVFDIIAPNIPQPEKANACEGLGYKVLNLNEIQLSEQQQRQFENNYSMEKGLITPPHTPVIEKLSNNSKIKIKNNFYADTH